MQGLPRGTSDYKCHEDLSAVIASEAKQSSAQGKCGLLRYDRKDGGETLMSHAHAFSSSRGHHCVAKPPDAVSMTFAIPKELERLQVSRRAVPHTEHHHGRRGGSALVLLDLLGPDDGG